MSVASWLFMIALALAGCDDAGVTGVTGPPNAGPAPCVPGELTREDGTCQPAGLPPDMPCPPGEMLLDDGKTCQKAGVPPSACGAGFLPDGKEGCEAILPADPCPVGQMAVPGDTACHEVAPCGSGTWGDIPVEANTQFVDQAYAGGNSDGTQAKPWTTIQQGVNAAAKGAIVAVAAGSYAEDVVIQGKAVRLWGRCPAMVEVGGTGAKLRTIQVLKKAANGAEIHSIAVTGAKLGISVSGASGVVIDRAWIHETGIYGLDIQDSLGPTSVMVKGSLVEQNHEIGVFVGGSNATIEATVVRSTLPDAQGTLGFGIAIQDHPETNARANVTVHACLVEQNHKTGVFVLGSDATIEATVVRSTHHDAQGKGHAIRIEDDLDTMARANVTVHACLIEQNHDLGVIVLGSDATIEATVVRSTLPNALGKYGRGIEVVDTHDTMARANVAIRACLVEQNHDLGVIVAGSDATIEATVIRATLLNSLGEFGRGLSIQSNPETMARANVTVHASLVEQNHEGVFVSGSDARIEATVVRSTLPDALGESGRGINIQPDPDTGTRANVTVHASLVEQNHDVGVYVSGSDATIEATVVSSTLPNALGKGGRGISIQSDQNTKERSNATLQACLIEQNHDIGVYVSSSDAMIVGSAVRDTEPQKSDDRFGDGIAVFIATVTMQDVEITRNVRAGVASFGGQVVITGGVITCNGFDLEGEPNVDLPFTFDGSTGWQCSDKAPAECTELGDCHVETTGIEAPPDLPPADPLPQ